MAKPGKWVWLKGKYPTLSDDPTYDDVKAAARDVYRDKSLEELAAVANALEDRKAELEQGLSGVNAELTAVETLMLAQFEDRGIEKIRVGGYNFAPKVEPAPKVEDPTVFKAWVTEKSPEILSVNYQTLRGIVSRCLEEERPLPPGVNVEVRETISRRK